MTDFIKEMINNKIIVIHGHSIAIHYYDRSVNLCRTLAPGNTNNLLPIEIANDLIKMTLEMFNFRYEICPMDQLEILKTKLV